MRQAKWPYVLVAALLIAVWIEFWRSTRHTDDAAAITSAPQQSLPPTQPVTVAPPVAVAEDPDTTLRQIAQDLAGTPAQRLAAQQKLVQVSISQRPLLRRLARESRDDDAHKLLTDRLGELDAQFALHPPPVSLHVQNATMDELAQALTRSLDTPFRGQSDPIAAYTLDAGNKPFWEVFSALQAQRPISIAYQTVGGAGSIVFRDLGPSPNRAGAALRIENFATSGNFLAYASMTRNSFGGAANYTIYTLSLKLVADPRLTPFDATPEFTFGPDDIGSAFTIDDGTRPGRAAAPRPSPLVPQFAGGPILAFNIPLRANSGSPGTKLTSLKLHARVLLATSIFSADLDDLETKIGQTLTVGPAAVTLQQFRRKGGPDPNVPNPNPGIQFQFVPVGPAAHLRLSILDAEGYTRWIGTTDGASAYGLFPGPLRLHAEIPQKTVETEVTLEIKNIPLPQ